MPSSGTRHAAKTGESVRTVVPSGWLIRVVVVLLGILRGEVTGSVRAAVSVHSRGVERLEAASKKCD
eukprot:COSAG06_NODE_11393_length_1516_cov_1.510939_2_plen_67_part_00